MSPTTALAPAVPEPSPADLARVGEIQRALLRLDWATDAVRAVLEQALERSYGLGVHTLEDAARRAGSRAEVLQTVLGALLVARLEDGRPLLDVFAAADAGLSPDEAAMVRGWSEVVEAPFRVGRVEGRAWELENLLDGLTYRVWMGVAQDEAPPAHLMARLVPLGPDWVCIGHAVPHPAGARARLLVVAARLAILRPALLLRNPAYLDQARRCQRVHHELFVEFFGGDEVVLAHGEFTRRLQEFIALQASRAVEGRAAAQHALGVPLRVLARARSVGLVSTAEAGVTFLPNYAAFLAGFGAEASAAEQALVLQYLRTPALDLLPFDRAAGRDAAAVSRTLARLLERPDLDWARDRDALRREFKRVGAVRPSVYVLPPLLQAHVDGIPERNAPCPCGSGRKYKACCGR